jgi:hypothetical protein
MMARRRRVQKKPRVQTKRKAQKGKGIYDDPKPDPEIRALFLRLKKAYDM